MPEFVHVLVHVLDLSGWCYAGDGGSDDNVDRTRLVTLGIRGEYLLLYHIVNCNPKSEMGLAVSMTYIWCTTPEYSVNGY
jgi:hypothetical protein